MKTDSLSNNQRILSVSEKTIFFSVLTSVFFHVIHKNWFLFLMRKGIHLNKQKQTREYNQNKRKLSIGKNGPSKKEYKNGMNTVIRALIF